MKQTESEQATPRPWEVHEGEDYIVVLNGEHDTSDNPVARFFERELADKVVEAVNSYDHLRNENKQLSILLRSWLACMEEPRPSDWEAIVKNLIADSRSLLKD